MDGDSIWNEVNLIQNSFITIWTAYMKWFSWHFGIHVAALGAILSASSIHDTGIPLAAGVFMGLFGVLGLIATMKMYTYDTKTRERIDQLIESENVSVPIFGSPILKWALVGTFLTKILILIAWVYVALTFSN